MQKLIISASTLLILFVISSRSQDFTLKGHTGNVNSIAFSPDSKTLVSCDENGKLIFWETENFTETYFLTTGSNITSVNFSPDGSTLVYTKLDGTVNFMNSSTKEVLNNFKVEGNCYYADFSNDGKYIAVCTSQEEEIKEIDNTVSHKQVDYIRIYNFSTFSQYKSLKTGSSDISIGSIFGTNIFKTYLSNSFNCDFSTDDNYISGGSNTKNIPIYSLQYSKYAPPYKSHSEKVYFVSFSPDGEYLASASKDETAKIWNIKTGKSVKTLSGHSGDVNSVSFSPDSKYLASGSDDESIKLWDVKTTKLLNTIDGFRFDILTVKFSPDGKYLAASGKYETVLLWKTSSILP